MAKKRFLVDASVYLRAPYALQAFEENVVFLPDTVLSDMEKYTHQPGEFRANAIEFFQLLEKLIDKNGSEPEIGSGGKLVFINAKGKNIYQLSNEYNATIVSRDPAVRVQAKAHLLSAEGFKAETAPNEHLLYSGRCYLYISDKEMAEFASKKSLRLNPNIPYMAVDETGTMISDDYHLTLNEYIVLLNSSHPESGSQLGRFNGQTIEPLIYTKQTPVFGVTARNVGQMFALDALLDPNTPLVMLLGPAGTGKSFLAMAMALQKTLEEERYKHILVSRPNTKMDNDIGYLKGDESEKVLPVLRGLMDNIDNLISGKKTIPGASPVDYLMETGVLKPQAMAYMRGRSIMDQFIIMDEMQNATPIQALSIVTRIGEGSKLVLMGDPDQIDNPYLDRQSNGLVYAAERMRGSPYCRQVTFLEKESTRSPLAKDALSRLRPKGY